MGVFGVFQAPPVAVSSFLYHRSPSSYLPSSSNIGRRRHGSGRISGLVLVNKEDSPSTSASVSTSLPTQEPTEQGDDPDPQDLEYVSQINRILELLRKNRDMLFNEVKLTVMIEDPRDVERRRLLGIDDENAPTREDLADALVQVNEGKIPTDRLALRMLAEEMLQWPNLEVEVPKKKQPGKSLYAKFTDTGVDPQEAAKRLNIDWDSAAEIEDAETDDVEVPPAVGYGALYLVSAFPVIIGMSGGAAEGTVRRVGGGGEGSIQEEESSSSSSSSMGTTAKPKKMIILDNKESEKQISVDPISLREPAANVHPIMYPVTTGPNVEVMSVPLHHLLPPAYAKSSTKFMSCSLPNSASSSPCFDLAFAKHKKKYKIHEGLLARQRSVALCNLERLRESHLRRSKSCGEGRACQPSVDFDLWSSIDNRRNNETEKRQEGKLTLHKKGGEKGESSYEDRFKCGACLFLPGLGKGKTVRARKELEAERGMPHVDIVSQRASLEKFECGSWRSSAVINYEEDGDAASNLFFDLPVELIRCSSVNDTESPVTTGFVFDNKDHHRKGVLKSTSTGGRPGKSLQESSCNSSRHVRFSTSSPTLCPASPTSPSSCITPRLHKVRDDFNAFLEAQSA